MTERQRNVICFVFSLVLTDFGFIFNPCIRSLYVASEERKHSDKRTSINDN